MSAVFLVIHLMLAVALVIAVLLQPSDGGALGGIGGGGFGGLMTGRQSANLLTRATAVIAGCFMATSMTLVILSANASKPTSILDRPAAEQTEPAPAPVEAPETGPKVPVAE